MPDTMNPRLSMTDIHKAFGSTQALAGVDLEVHAGEVLALVGENGAGKSTLMKILSGALRADRGKMVLEGEEYNPQTPHQSREHGVAMIYQELSLAPHLTVVENIFLGRDQTRFGWLQKEAENKVAREALKRVGAEDIPLQKKIASLNPAQRQLVEIARALAGDAKVIVMDEPTSSLTQLDTENLFRVISDLKNEGTSVIYISHFLEEVQEVADRVVVLRDGQTVGGGMIEELDIPQIIRLMVGREVEELYPRIPHDPGDVLLEIDGVSGKNKPSDVSLRIRKGEILGIAGLVGAGRTEFLRVLFGLDPIREGQIRVTHLDLSLEKKSNPGSRWSAGLGMLSEDRKEEGLAVELSISENMTLTRLAPYKRFGFFLPWLRRGKSEEVANQLNIVCRSVEAPVSSLSGGNQQKVAFARLVHHDADLLLLDEPTRGIDVGSKSQIYRLIGESAAAGKAVLMVSSYLPELFGVCDRIAVMRRGRLSEAKDADQWTEDEVLHYAVAEVA
ncbi:MAG: sugar ABC transporter ATP-binding protein [Candidatus Omnitrophica bacterium]|nr:sugar ABC transporter ATP-binding protein [Candidatus Omnitrophota bacterium]